MGRVDSFCRICLQNNRVLRDRLYSELIFGHPSSLRSALKEDPKPQYNHDDYVSELKNRLQTAHRLAKDNIVASKNRSKDYYEKKTEGMRLSVRDKVLLFDETVRRGRSKKLNAQWIGSYRTVWVRVIFVLVDIVLLFGKTIRKSGVRRCSRKLGGGEC